MFKIGMIDQIMRCSIELSYDSCLKNIRYANAYLMLILLASDWSTAEQKIIIKQNLTISETLFVLKLNNIVYCIL